MAPHVSSTEDCLEQLIADISILTREVPAKRLKEILNNTLQPNACDVAGSGDFRVLPSSAQMNKLLKAKKDKKHQGRGLLSSVFVFAFVIVVTISVVIGASMLYYGKEDVFYVSVQLLNKVLPEVINNNIANQLQTTYTLFLRQLRSISVEAGIHALGKHIQDERSCVVSNPLYVQQQERDNYPCSECSKVERILTTKTGVDPQPVSPLLLVHPQPVMFRKWGSNVTMRQLQDQVMSNLYILNSFRTNLDSNVDYITQVQDLASDEVISQLETDPSVHLKWYSGFYATSHIFKKLFQRPKLIPPDILIGVKKVLLVDGPDYPPFQLSSLNLTKNEALWYAQGSGSRTLVLTPRDGCLDECATLTARLSPSDILVFRPRIWIAHSMSNDNSTSLSLMGRILLEW